MRLSVTDPSSQKIVKTRVRGMLTNYWQIRYIRLKQIGVPTGGSQDISSKAEMAAEISRAEPLNLMRIIPTEEKP